MINWLMINYLPSLVLYELFYFCGVYAVVVGWMVSFVFLYMVLCVVNWRCLRLYISQPVMLVLCLSVKVMANGWRSTLPFLCGVMAGDQLCLFSVEPHSLCADPTLSISSFWATFALCRPNPLSLSLFLLSEPHSLYADPTLSLSLGFFLLSQPSLSLTRSLSLCVFLPSEPHLLCADPTLSLSLSLCLCCSVYFFLLSHIYSVQTQPSLTLSPSVSLSLFLPSEAVPVLLVLLCCTGLLPLHHPAHPPTPTPFPHQGHNHWWGTYLSWLKPHYIVPHLTLFLSPLWQAGLASLWPLQGHAHTVGPALFPPETTLRLYWARPLSHTTLWHIPPWLGSTLYHPSPIQSHSQAGLALVSSLQGHSILSGLPGFLLKLG